MNFTSESLAIVLIFIGMALVSFLISLPSILKEDGTLKEDVTKN